VKRICLLGAAIAGILILGVATALAATPNATSAKAKSKATSGTKFSATDDLSLQVPSGATDVTADEQSGAEAGAVSSKPFGKGFAFVSYTTALSGNLTGKWQQWFKTGTLYGTYVLTPSDNTPPTTSTSFAAASYTGTFVIKGGSGAYAKATGKGTLKASTSDSVHFVFKESGKYKLPAAATS